MTENEQVQETPDGAQFRILEFNGSVNSERAIRQVRTPIRVIVGNPPYSVGQSSANDNNQNLSYPILDARIGASYAKKSTATLKRNLYDSYVRAIRWASDRIGDSGVIAYVTNASFIDGNSMDGVRACLSEEFSSIWVFNGRGNQRTSGETSRQEGGKIFGSGSRAPISLTLLVKDPAHYGPCELYYHDIGNYQSREQKLNVIREFGSVENVQWQRIIPNAQYDWINQRDPAFERFIGIGERLSEAEAFFEISGGGVSTSRDSWVYNYSSEALLANVNQLIDFYNDQIALVQPGNPDVRRIGNLVSNAPDRIKWSAGLLAAAQRGKSLSLHSSSVVQSMYRPFAKQWLYFDNSLNERVSQNPHMFPKEGFSNKAIYVTGVSAGKAFSTLLVDCVPNLHLLDSGQLFPLDWCEAVEGDTDLAGLSGQSENGYIRHDGINNFMLEQYRQVYADPSITKEDIFYYVYGVLHSPEYRERFAADLKKMLPRIPFTEDFRAFSDAGRELGELHVGYESIDPWPVAETRTQMPFSADGQALDDRKLYRVEKMKFGKDGKKVDKSTIIYNPHFTLSDIPFGAYDYIVNGKSALDWIMERYAITQDKESKIVNDPNEWSDDPRYIVDLVKRIVRVSIETNRIVASLPPLNERDVETALSVNSVSAR